MTLAPAGAVYTRSSSRLPPARPGVPLAQNQLAASWRPLVDLTDSSLAPVRLRLARHVSQWLSGREPRWSWCSRLSVPGLRQQVLLHAGLTTHLATSPERVPTQLWTPAWAALVEAMQRFDQLDWRRRALVVFQLAQLSFHRVALALAERVESDGSIEADRFRYDVARVAASTPGQADFALRVFNELTKSADRRLRLGAAFQGIGHSLRDKRALGVARSFAEQGAAALDPDDQRWTSALLASRYYRAVALLHAADGSAGSAESAATQAMAWHSTVTAEARDEADRLVALENDRYLLELELRLQPTRTVALARRLADLDPQCVQARSAIGDALAGAGELADAAGWYERAGDLGSAVGAVAWYRAALCYEALGADGPRLQALYRCLDLDPFAVEPREALRLYDDVDELRRAHNHA